MRTFVCLLLPLLLLLLGRAGAADDDDDDGEPSSLAQQVVANVSPTPLADMASGAAQASFGAAGPPAKQLPQGQGAVDCGTEGDDNAAAWCAPLLREHFHAGLDQSRKTSGAREAAYYGKHAPIDMGAKEDTGGRLAPWEVMRGFVFGTDYVLACSPDDGQHMITPVKEQATLDERWFKADPARSGYPGKKLVGDGCSARSRTGPSLIVVLRQQGWRKLLQQRFGGLDAHNALELRAHPGPQLLFLHEEEKVSLLQDNARKAAQMPGADAPAVEAALGLLQRTHVVPTRVSGRIAPGSSGGSPVSASPTAPVGAGQIDLRNADWSQLRRLHTSVCQRHTALRQADANQNEEPNSHGDAMCLLSDTQNREVFTNNKKTYTAKVGLSVRSVASATAAVTRSVLGGETL